MKRTLFLPLLLAACFASAQPEEVSTLHYIYTEKTLNRKGQEEVSNTRDYKFCLDGDVLVMDRVWTPDRGFKRQLLDPKKRLIASIRNERKDYVLEQLDSIYYPASNDIQLTPTDETKTINGFNCKKYTLQYALSITMGVDRPAIVIPSKGMFYEFEIWITTDIKMNDAYNPYIFCSLIQNQRHELYPYEGVVVQLKQKLTYGKRTWNSETVLDKEMLKVPAQKAVWPWNEPVPGFALLQVYNAPSGTTIYYRGGDRTPLKQFNRMKDFLEQTTGQEKPKFKQDLITGIFW